MLRNIKLHSFCTGRPPATAPCVHCFLSGDLADSKLPHCPKHETVDGCIAQQAGIVSVGVGDGSGGGQGSQWGHCVAKFRNLDLVKFCGYFPWDFSDDVFTIPRFPERGGRDYRISCLFFSVISNIKPFWGHEFTGQVCVENI